MQAEAEIAAVELHDVAGDEQRRAENDRHVPAQLRILPRQVEFPTQQEEIDRKIDAEQGHEDGRDRLRVGAVGGEGIVADGKAAGAGRAEGVAERVKQRLAAGQIKEDLQHRQAKIDPVEDLGRIGHPRHHLGDRRPGALGPQQVDGLAAVHPDDGQHEHQNAHAADPVRKAAPEQHALVELLHRGQDARAGGGKAGDHLEHGVEIKRDLPRKRERQRADERKHDPAERHCDQPFFRVHDGPLAAAQPQRQRTEHCRAQHHPEEIPAAYLMVDQRHEQRRQHQRGPDQQHRAQHIDDRPLIHGPALLPECPPACRAPRCRSRR